MTEQPTTPSLADLQHWTWVMGRAQQMMLEQGLAAMHSAPGADLPGMAQVRDFWSDSLALWQRFLDPSASRPEEPAAQARDKRFANEAWRENPMYDWIRQSYFLISDHLLRGVEALEGVDEKQKAQLRFAARGLVDAMSPSNFALTNPEVIEKTIATKGQNLLKGLEHMLADIRRGQLTHVPEGAFELGRNLAVTPGKVIHRTPLYELIQYAPATPDVKIGRASCRERV